MILTKCAACAAPLAHNAPRCVRCHTRYCDATCQHDHWRRGHKQIYARRMLGNDHLITTNLLELLSVIIIDEVQQHRDAADPSEDLREAVTTLEDLCKRGRRIFGATHPQTLKFEKNLKRARNLLVSIARGG